MSFFTFVSWGIFFLGICAVWLGGVWVRDYILSNFNIVCMEDDEEERFWTPSTRHVLISVGTFVLVFALCWYIKPELHFGLRTGMAILGAFAAMLANIRYEVRETR